MNKNKCPFFVVLKIVALIGCFFYCNSFGAISCTRINNPPDDRFYVPDSNNASSGDFIRIINFTPYDLFTSIKSGGVVVEGHRQKDAPFQQIAASAIKSNGFLNLQGMESRKFKVFSMRFWILKDEHSLNTYYNEFCNKSIGYCLSPAEITGLRKISIFITDKTLKANLEYDFTLSPECPICSNRFNRSELILVLNCGHKFHHKCCQSIMRSNPCPTCQTPVNYYETRTAITSEIITIGEMDKIM